MYKISNKVIKVGSNVDEQEKRTCHLVDFVVPVFHRVKMKESEKIDKYLDLARELKSSRTRW